jgi:hypothetical protein
MEISVRTRDIVWNDDLQNQVRRSIEFAVDRHRTRIDRISVYLTDVNGPRGGVDKRCQLIADVRGANPVTILETGDDLMAMLNRAARRLGYRIGRRIHRQRVAGAPEHRGTIRVA